MVASFRLGPAQLDRDGGERLAGAQRFFEH